MHVFTDIRSLRAHLQPLRRAGQRIGLVPTMGNLHAGHLSLVHRALGSCEQVVATIFVNPMQFAAGEDLDNYPRTPEADQALLEQAGCHALFMPPVTEVYPNGLGTQTRVSVPGISEGHCGASRPGHFDGVATVVSKLFNLVEPDQAFFGEKDFQQLAVIRKLVSDLCFNLDIIGVPTCREASGLAMSSRNGYLSPEERAIAPGLYRTLEGLKTQLLQGERDYPALELSAQHTLQHAGFQPDYLHICQALTLLPASAADRELVILAAAFLGRTRLIDNLTVTLP